MARSNWFAFVAVTAVGLSLIVSPVRAQDAVVKLVHVATGKVLAVADDSEEAGARVLLAADEANEARQWRLVKDGEHLKVVNRKSGKVLDVYENSKDDGGQVIQWDEKAEENGNQRWSWEGTGEQRRLKGKDSGLVLDVAADGSGVVQKKADEKAKSQLWKVVEVKP
jgi:hypothetical protein